MKRLWWWKTGVDIGILRLHFETFFYLQLQNWLVKLKSKWSMSHFELKISHCLEHFVWWESHTWQRAIYLPLIHLGIVSTSTGTLQSANLDCKESLEIIYPWKGHVLKFYKGPSYLRTYPFICFSWSSLVSLYYRKNTS